MTTLYDAAMRNFQAAADILVSLQSSRLDLIGEARTGLISRPRLSIRAGYNDVTPFFGVCLPTSGQAEIIAGESGKGIELRCSSADWMTFEGTLPRSLSTESCYVEIQASSGRPMVADVFVRDFIEDGATRDSGHRECHIAMDAVTICKLELAEKADDVTGRRVILHLRHPTSRLILDRLAITMI